jgi:hypothetical protein
MPFDQAFSAASTDRVIGAMYPIQPRAIRPASKAVRRSRLHAHRLLFEIDLSTVVVGRTNPGEGRRSRFMTSDARRQMLAVQRRPPVHMAPHAGLDACLRGGEGKQCSRRPLVQRRILYIININTRCSV